MGAFDAYAYSNTSYDPSFKAITANLWTVTLGNTIIYTGATPMTDYSDKIAGTYKISLMVTNEASVDSEVVSKFVAVVIDTTGQTATVSTNDAGAYPHQTTVELTMADEAGGSGYSQSYFVTTNSTTIPTSWGSMSTSTTAQAIVTDYPADTYIHYKVLDYAGNETIGYYGPYSITNDPTADTDGDGVSDEDEVAAGSNPDDPDSTPSDKNGDGTLDNPTADTDGDGVSDADEVAAGFDPDDPNSTPYDALQRYIDENAADGAEDNLSRVISINRTNPYESSEVITKTQDTVVRS